MRPLPWGQMFTKIQHLRAPWGQIALALLLSNTLNFGYILNHSVPQFQSTVKMEITIASTLY